MSLAPFEESCPSFVVTKLWVCVVIGTGNPWVFLTVPVPVPVKTRTRLAGTGFYHGLAYHTHGYTRTHTRGG